VELVGRDRKLRRSTLRMINNLSVCIFHSGHTHSGKVKIACIDNGPGGLGSRVRGPGGHPLKRMKGPGFKCTPPFPFRKIASFSEPTASLLQQVYKAPGIKQATSACTASQKSREMVSRLEGLGQGLG